MLSNIAERQSPWLAPTGPMHDVVISSRVRLARNLVGLPFLPKCNEQQATEIVSRLTRTSLDMLGEENAFFVDVARAPATDRDLLIERHLISKPFAEAQGPRGAVIAQDETVSLMFNEEDHLRMQVLRSGMQIREAFEQMTELENRIEQQVSFAYSDQWGYLTACPTNVGTGLRVSVMLHLPAMTLTGQIPKLAHAVHDLQMAIRGLYGEGSDATGDLYQISNQRTLGVSEEDILRHFVSTMIPQLLAYERGARDALRKNSPTQLADRIHRAVAILQSARVVAVGEMMHLLSMVRMGLLIECVEGVDLATINELLLLSQPAHLQRIHSLDGASPPIDIARASGLRTQLQDVRVTL